eukprot:tig00000571_g2156.t1
MKAKPRTGLSGPKGKAIGKKDAGVQKVNPFERRVNKRKFDVVNRKVKGEQGERGASRSKAIEARKATLLVEYSQQGKSNAFVDRRFGERDERISEEDKYLMRFQRERQSRASKKSLYNLEDDEEGGAQLTHLGRSLAEIDDFKDDIPLSDEEDADKGQVGADFVSDFHFGGGLVPSKKREGGEGGEAEGGGEEEGEGEGRTKSKKEVMEEIIAKSKHHKAEQRKQREERDELLEKLDLEFDSIRGLLSSSKRGGAGADPKDRHEQAHAHEEDKKKVAAAAPAAAAAAAPTAAAKQQADDDDYERTVRELRLERRVQAAEKMKKPEDVAREEKERLERLEVRTLFLDGGGEDFEGPRRERLRRMRGDYDPDSDTEAKAMPASAPLGGYKARRLRAKMAAEAERLEKAAQEGSSSGSEDDGEGSGSEDEEDEEDEDEDEDEGPKKKKAKKDEKANAKAKKEKKAKVPKDESADALDGNFALEGEEGEEEGEGSGSGSGEEEEEGDEGDEEGSASGSGSGEEEGEEEGEEGEEDEGVDLEDEAGEDLEAWVSRRRTLRAPAGADKEEEEGEEEEPAAPPPVEEMPYVFECPKSYKELRKLLRLYGKTAADRGTVLERIIVCNRAALGPENRKKMEGAAVFYRVLLEHVRGIGLGRSAGGPPGGRGPVDLAELDSVFRHVHKLTQEMPEVAAAAFRELVGAWSEETSRGLLEGLPEGLEEGGGGGEGATAAPSLWPDAGQLVLLKLPPALFPASDFSHPVTTPALSLACRWLAQCPLRSPHDLLAALFLCSLAYVYCAPGKRYCPEAIGFLHACLASFLSAYPSPAPAPASAGPKRKKGDAGEAAGAPPRGPRWPPLAACPSAATLGDLLAVKDRKAAAKLSPAPLRLDELGTPAADGFLASDQFRVNAAANAYALMGRFAALLEGNAAYGDVYGPVLATLRQARAAALPAALREAHGALAARIEAKAAEAERARRPLRLQARKPAPIKMFNPKFDEQFGRNLRPADVDRDRAEEKKMKRQYTNEMKGAVRELRKDASFLAQTKHREMQAEDAERKEKTKRLMAELGMQAHEAKVYEKLKKKGKPL